MWSIAERLVNAMRIVSAQTLTSWQPRKSHRGKRARIGASSNQKGCQLILYVVPLRLGPGIDPN